MIEYLVIILVMLLKKMYVHKNIICSSHAYSVIEGRLSKSCTSNARVDIIGFTFEVLYLYFVKNILLNLCYSIVLVGVI